MKKILLTVLITLIILTAGTVGVYRWLRGEGGREVLKSEEIIQMERDEGKTNAFQNISVEDVIPLQLYGSGKNLLTYEYENVFNPEEGQKNYSRIKRIMDKTEATFEEPIIAYNLFGTGENTLYFYFETDNNLSVRYTITSRDNAVVDFTRVAINKDMSSVSRKHEFVVRGIVPGRENLIILGLYNGEEQVQSITYMFDAKQPVVGKNMLVYSKGESKEESTNGLYFVFPKEKNRVCLYDNSGILRGELIQEQPAGRRLIMSEASFFYSISNNRIARISNIGQVMDTYTLENYQELADFDYDGFETLYITAYPKGSKDGRGQCELIRLNINTKRVEKVLSIDYRIEFNGITLLNGGDAILSTQRPYGSLLISGIAGESAKVSGVLGDKKAWKNTAYRKMVYQLTGKEEVASRQGLIIYNKDKSREKFYSVSFMNQNRKEKSNSYYYEYLINISKKEFVVSVKIPAANSHKGGSGQSYENHSILCSSSGEYGEYDMKGKPIKVFDTGFLIQSAVKANLRKNWFY
ncbi:MAG: hypothetical protein LBR68_03200 [Lachnoclostridium sp.]|nr:hypothetical protein [Lachnoclostridium sp.]